MISTRVKAVILTVSLALVLFIIVGGLGVLIYYHWQFALVALLASLAFLFFALRFLSQAIRW